MPKTKLGNEIKNYGYKKLKTNQCRLASTLDDPDVTKKVKEILQRYKELQATIQRNESIIHMLRMQIQQLQNKEPSVAESVSFFIV